MVIVNSFVRCLLFFFFYYFIYFFLYFIVFICKLYKGQAKKYYNVTHTCFYLCSYDLLRYCQLCWITARQVLWVLDWVSDRALLVA